MRAGQKPRSVFLEKLPLSLVTFCLLISVVYAQTVPTRATPDDINHWLRSGDPRMVAWGAFFAAKSVDADELPVLAFLAENYQAAPPQQYDTSGSFLPRTPEQKQKLDSMQTVLDSLIQLHGRVTYEAVAAVLPDFPAQALTLFATMSEPERSHRAMALYATRDVVDKSYDWHRLAQQQMIHMAAAILALDPSPGFAATLINETIVILKVAVTDDNQKRDGTFVSGICGDSFAMDPSPGWPQPYTYVVEQHWKTDADNEEILVQGEPSITTRRARSNSSCSALPGFTSVQRLLLARQIAGLPSDALGMGTLQYETLRYTGPADYLAGLASLVEAHRTPFRALARVLESKGFLSATEAATAIPTFSVEVQDQRKARDQPIPLPLSLDPRTTIGPYKPDTGWFVKTPA